MNYFIIAVKVFLFVSIINVWFFRFGEVTHRRGGIAISLRDEFKVYGVSNSMMFFVGGLKVFLATMLLASIWMSSLAVPAAMGMGLLMLGIITMHLKVGEAVTRTYPALCIFLLSVLIVLYHFLIQYGARYQYTFPMNS